MHTNKIYKKFLETFLAILPMVFIITLIYLISAFSNLLKSSDGKQLISLETFIPFIICSFTLVIGSTIFQLGADNALHKVGTLIGQHITQKRSIFFLSIVTIFLGTLISIAEPDLAILGDVVGKSFGNGGDWIVRIVAGIGVGIFLVIGLIRIMTQKSIKYVFLGGYILILGIAAIFGPKDGQSFLSVAYDTSGVTTGAATVPFVISFGAAVASARGGKDTASDSFGLSGIMSLGPVLTMLLLCFSYPKCNIAEVDIPTCLDQIKSGIFWEMIIDVCYGVGPIFLFFLIYNWIFIKLNRARLFQIIVGFIFVFIGLYIFLISASLGLKGLGKEFGHNTTSNPEIHYLLIVFGLLTGIIIVMGEPSIQILSKQVEEISGGMIKKKTLMIALSIGVGTAITLELARNLFWNGFSSYYLFIPIYVIALILMFFVPDIYTAIAFDSGGIASGTISVCLVMPIVIGMVTCQQHIDNGFGIIGMVSAFPIICIQILGINAKIKNNVLLKKARNKIYNKTIEQQVIHFDI